MLSPRGIATIRKALERGSFSNQTSQMYLKKAILALSDALKFVASALLRAQRNARYHRSKSGRESMRKYSLSAKAAAAHKRYRMSEKGKKKTLELSRKYRARPEVKQYVNLKMRGYRKSKEIRTDEVKET